MLSLYAIRYPDTLLIESLTEKPNQISPAIAYLHFTITPTLSGMRILGKAWKNLG